MIWSVPPLKNALKLLYFKELQEQSKSLSKKKEDPSLLRVGLKCYQQLISFSWAKSLTEWLERAPDVLDTLSAIAVPDNYLSNCTFWSHHLKAMTNSTIITASCTSPVSNPVYFLLKIQIACYYPGLETKKNKKEILLIYTKTTVQLHHKIQCIEEGMTTC